MPPPPPPYEQKAESGERSATGLRAPARAVALRATGNTPRATEEAYKELAALYRELDGDIAGLAPRCDGRGICCDFDRVDHVLYASKLEVDFVKDHDPALRHLWASGNACPFLDESGRCGAREVRMLGCRTYYCQSGFEAYAAELYERYYARIKAIVLKHDLDWRYAPALVQFRDGS